MIVCYSGTRMWHTIGQNCDRSSKPSKGQKPN